MAGDGVVKHYHIKKTDSGQFYISDSQKFDTLPELVVYHKHETSGETFSDSNHVCRLLQDNVYGAAIMTCGHVRVHPVHAMNAE